MFRILFAEDDTTTRMTVAEYLRDEGHDVVDVKDGVYALEALKSEGPFDLILSDIEMPRLQGHLLLQQIEKLYPEMKRALLTAHSTDKYIGIATQFGITNIITKTNPLHLADLAAYIGALLNDDIFGIERYFRGQTAIETLEVTRPKDIEGHIKSIIEKYAIEDDGSLEQAFVEILTNAIYYGVLDEDGANKQDWDREVEIAAGEVVVQCAKDEDKVAVSICDSGGRLKKKKLLFWLSRQIRRTAVGLPLGMMDTHGRGLFFSREFMDQLIVNIEQGKRTEIICIKYLGTQLEGPKPLLINEI
ncbi:MAG: response regulator [Deltaproteobacteria bacterium]|nr:response regulator [Deltaproteobacteria bacterium]MBT6434950.1 response regulator [Deltaproteobacteria bacterium]MBT6488356.1 response regulator [Deltaproteobacteria bacterium]